MSNRADDEDLDLVVSTRAGIVHAETRTAAPEHLLRLLEHAGFTRHTPTPVRTPAPTYVFHALPSDIPPDEARSIAARATGYAFAAGYTFAIDNHLRNDRAGQDAYDEYKGRRTRPVGTPPAPHSPNTAARKSR